jgi:membrane protease YdiL (CAAX protease family)
MSRARIGVEIAIVLGLSLGLSALYSVVNILVRLTRDTPLSEQTATLNASRSPLPWADFSYQVLGIVQGLVPVALVIFLLWSSAQPRLGKLGLDGKRWASDGLAGVGLAALIGIPGLGVYLVGRELDLTVNVIPTALNTYWWTVPMLIALAMKAGIVEEIIAVGYLFARLREMAVPVWAIIVLQAFLRGTYHLYQGFGAFVGNVAMGLVFGFICARTGRLAPLIIGHAVIDTVVFVGYPLTADLLGNFSES